MWEKVQQNLVSGSLKSEANDAMSTSMWWECFGKIFKKVLSSNTKNDIKRPQNKKTGENFKEDEVQTIYDLVDKLELNELTIVFFYKQWQTIHKIGKLVSNKIREVNIDQNWNTSLFILVSYFF